MYTNTPFVLLAAATALPATLAETIWATPHDSYSSSVGVLGCKVNTNRIAYFPGSVDCNNICVSVSCSGRSVALLRVDQSGGAHDMSYDAWNYLSTGFSALDRPSMGGPVEMQYEPLDPAACAPLIYTPGGALPLSASNSINFLASCLAQSGSWVANNHVLYNILDPVCDWGKDEVCSLNLATSNQPSCPSTLGLLAPLDTLSVTNIVYGTGALSNVRKRTDVTGLSIHQKRVANAASRPVEGGLFGVKATAVLAVVVATMAQLFLATV